jgi:DNA polymerase I-like protein with 3'-5' exonuclease and polymerase domains
VKVAIIETKISKNNYANYFDNKFEFDLYQLCSDPNLKKVLKKDCDINIDTSKYDWVILVGSEALKFFTKQTAITTYSGKKVEANFLAIINPAMLTFKPEAAPLWEASKKSILDYISGEVEVGTISDAIAIGIDDSVEAKEYLLSAIKHNSEYVSVDCETTGLYPLDGYLQGVSISYDGIKGAYIAAECFDEDNVDLFQKLIKNKTVVFHNAKFDIGFIEYHLGVKFYNFEDTMLLHYIIDETPGTHGLKDLAIKFTKYGNYEKDLDYWMEQFCKEKGVKKADFKWEWIPFEVMYPYAAMDSLVTIILFNKFKKIKDNSKLKYVYDNILIKGTRFLVDVQSNGVPFDTNRLKLAQKLMEDDISQAITELYKNPEIAKFEAVQGKEFNPNSVPQLRSLLYDFLKLKPVNKKTATGALSTDAEVLEQLTEQSEVPKLILAIRQKSKIKNTYLDKIIPQLNNDGKLRTNFNLHTTTSGRLSSSGKLNMQQLPRDNSIVKGCIRAPIGYKIVSVDLQTAEVYVAAVLSGDKALMQVFSSGGDFHSTIAKIVFKLPCAVEDVKELYPEARQAAKAITFGIMYGAGPHKISEQITKDSGNPYSVEDAAKVISDYFKSFPDLRKWIDKNLKFIEANGFIYSCFGRKRRLPNVNSTDKGLQGHSLRSGLNFLVQSAASDINLLGAIDMQDFIVAHKLKSKIFALVHDSILALVPDDEVSLYTKMLVQYIQLDRGVSIPGSPIHCDIEVAEDYSMGKFEKQYGDLI